MLAGGLGSQLVECVGGVESHRRELSQRRGVELDVGRSNARMSFDCATGVLPTAQGDLDARGGPAGAADMSAPGLAVAEFADPFGDAGSVGGAAIWASAVGVSCMASYLSYRGASSPIAATRSRRGHAPNCLG
jgi:hypothetical protein